MDPEKNGSGGGGDGGGVEAERSGNGGGAGGGEADQSTPLRHQEGNYARNNFIARSTRIRMAASQVQGGPAGVYALMCGTLCCSVLIAIVFLVLLNIVSITSIIIGAMHLNDCPAQPNIPVMLIALGVIAFVIGIFDTMDRAKERRAAQGTSGVVIEEDEDIKKPSCYICINSVLKTAQLVLFVYTCVIVYRIFSTVSYSPDPNFSGAAGEENHYCHAVVYLFAFWFLTATLIVLGAVLVFLLCVCICAGALLVAASD